MRDTNHYKELIERNPNATFGITLAADAVFAGRYGFYSEVHNHHRDVRWTTIARYLRDEYGESLSGDDVLREMGKGMK